MERSSEGGRTTTGRGYGAVLCECVDWQIDALFLTALLTVIGKIKVFDRRKHSVNDPDYSPLFFGNYGDIPYEEYAQDFEKTMNDSDATYEIMVKDIYFAGSYLLQTKYRYIRLAYLCFFTGLIVSVIIYMIQYFQ